MIFDSGSRWLNADDSHKEIIFNNASEVPLVLGGVGYYRCFSKAEVSKSLTLWTLIKSIYARLGWWYWYTITYPCYQLWLLLPPLPNLTRVNYDKAWWREIAEVLRTDPEKIKPMNRAQVLSSFELILLFELYLPFELFIALRELHSYICKELSSSIFALWVSEWVRHR